MHARRYDTTRYVCDMAQGGMCQCVCVCVSRRVNLFEDLRFWRSVDLNMSAFDSAMKSWPDDIDTWRLALIYNNTVSMRHLCGSCVRDSRIWPIIKASEKHVGPMHVWPLCVGLWAKLTCAFWCGQGPEDSLTY